MLSDTERRRYARHLVLPEIGEEGQKKLLSSSVLVVGCGGLGSVAAGYLAAMGVGTIGLVDDDRVELSNLQRQILFETADIGTAKIQAAENRLNELNAEIKVTTYMTRLDAENAADIVKHYDVVVDALDNFKSRRALHDACFNAQKPLIFAAISGFESQITCFKSYLGVPHPCLYCFMPNTPEREISCEQEGIIGALAGMIGSQQALEAVKELLQIGESLSGRISRYAALTGTTRMSILLRDASCGYCNKQQG